VVGNTRIFFRSPDVWYGASKTVRGRRVPKEKAPPMSAQLGGAEGNFERKVVSKNSSHIGKSTENGEGGGTGRNGQFLFA